MDLFEGVYWEAGDILDLQRTFSFEVVNTEFNIQ